MLNAFLSEGSGLRVEERIPQARTAYAIPKDAMRFPFSFPLLKSVFKTYVDPLDPFNIPYAAP